MNTIILEADQKTLEKVISYLNSLKIKFEIKEERNYSEEFEKKMDESIQYSKEGNLRTISLDEIWK
jgi:predicted transglutaminase-like protease